MVDPKVLEIRLRFRVKIRNLMDEARDIRSRERSIVFAKKDGEPALEALVRRSGLDRARTSLQMHRIGVVRQEARSALLAYALWRGRSYARTESACARLAASGELPEGIDVRRISQILASVGEVKLSPNEVHLWILGKLEPQAAAEIHKVE